MANMRMSCGLAALLPALLYRAISGRVPNSAVARAVRDELVPLSQLAAGRYSPAFLAGIDAGLAVHPGRRPQSMADLRDALDGCWFPAVPGVAPAATPPAPPVPPPPPAEPWWSAAAGWWRTLFRR